MTDRELLELAAKAAGIELRWHPDGTAYSDSRCKDYWGVWNPIADDGDALRLAVKLALKIEQRDGCIVVQWVDRRGNPEEWPDCLAVPINGDPYAATRRVIVRAAAEIGRSMK